MLVKKTPEGLVHHLKSIPLFQGFSDDKLRHFVEYTQEKMERKGTVLFPPDAPNDRFFIVASGWVKLFRETLDGTEAVIDILTAPHCFGEIGLAGTEGMPYGAEVIEDAVLVSLPRFLLAEEVRHNSLFGLAVLQTLTRQKMNRDLEIEHRTVQTAPQRIGCFLLKLCGEQTSGPVTLHLPYDKAVIASRLGMQPETLSRALSRLCGDADIKIKGASVDIRDIRRLVDYTCSACSSSFPCKQ